MAARVIKPRSVLEFQEKPSMQNRWKDQINPEQNVATRDIDDIVLDTQVKELTLQQLLL